MTTPAAEPWRDQRPGTLERHPDDGWIRATPLPLGSWMQAALAGIADAMLPHGEAGAPVDAATRDEICLGLRRTMRYMAPLSRFGLLLLVAVFDLAPLWRGVAPRRLGGLAPERAAAVLDGIAHSRLALLRTALTALRAAILTNYYDLPSVHQQIGYDPIAFMRARIALRERLLAGGEAGPEDAP